MTFNKDERIDLSFREYAVALTEEYFADFHSAVAQDKKFYEKIKLSNEVQISFGVLGFLLLVFSIATLWSTYTSYK